MNGRNSNRGQGRGSRVNGQGQRQGQGLGQSQRQGQGRQDGGRGRGYTSSSFCECAKCGAKIPHLRGVKCTDSKCPECGNTMVNEALLDKKDK